MADEITAVGVSVICTVAEGRQVSFSTAFAIDMSSEKKSAILDELFMLGDRQASKYEAPALRKELEDVTDKLALLDGDVATAEGNYHKAQADLDVQIETFNGDIKRTTEVGYERHTRSGRGGSYVPKGGDAQSIAAANAGIEHAVAAKARNDSERSLFLSNIDTNKQRMAARIEYLKGKLAEIDKLVT